MYLNSTNFIYIFNVIVNVTWSELSDWSNWTYVCDSAEKYRYRQCSGSNPKGHEMSRVTGLGLLKIQVKHKQHQFVCFSEAREKTPYCNSS